MENTVHVKNSADTDANQIPIQLRLSQWQHSVRVWMSVSLIVSDFTSIVLAGFFAIAARLILGDGWHFDLFRQVIPIALICITAYALNGLYPAIGVGNVDELRRITISTSVVILGFAALTFWVRNPENYSRMTIGLTWFFGLGLIPLGRVLLRNLGAHFEIWGEPVAIIGYGDLGRRIFDHLRQNRMLGLFPVIALGSFGGEFDLKDDSRTISIEEAFEQNLLCLIGVKSAVLIPSEIPAVLSKKIINHQLGNFRRLILVPDQNNLGSISITPMTIDGILGLEVHQNLLNIMAKIQKRIIDMIGSFLGLVILSPFFAMIMILIKRDSFGPSIYSQKRIGIGGNFFRMVKFRTMYVNSDEMLIDHIENDPDLKHEWDKYQKLKEDPRITSVGKFLRKFSIDELPQLWNVFKGEMSLVGPRPFFWDQKDEYGEAYAQYIQVLPGLTGMWQVSGRNNTTFAERAHFDEYYVRNWSIWLDIYILARTIWVVLKQDGAF